jgi:uncharacterized membrane protein
MNAQTLFLTALLTLAIDVPWLYGNMEWSGSVIRRVQGTPIKLRYAPAVVVYVAIAYLILKCRSPLEAALTGLATYAIYDFTNYSTLRHYDLTFAITDTLWGGALFWLVYTAAHALKLA